MYFGNTDMSFQKGAVSEMIRQFTRGCFEILILTFFIHCGPFNPFDMRPEMTLVHLDFEGSSDISSDTILYDQSGNSNNGIIHGDPIWRSGVSGSALYFDGIDDYVSVNCSDSMFSFDTLDFTISLWQRTSGTDTNRMDIICKGSPGSSGICISVYELHFTAYFGRNSIVCTDTSIHFNDNRWHNLMLRRRSNRITFNIDGRTIDSQNYEGNLTTGDQLLIGGTGSDSYSHFAGLVDEVYIANYAWTDQEAAEELKKYN